MAVVQANGLLEDASQFESGNHGTFVGVCDGHGGPEASRYIRHNMFQNLGKYNCIARRIIEAALQVAAMKREMRYSDLKSIDRGIRRHFHDDITIIVLFLDHFLVSSSYASPVLSLTGGKDPDFLCEWRS